MSEHGETVILPSPKRRHRRMLHLLAEVVDAATESALSVPIPKEDSPQVFFDISFLERGINALKVVRMLCGNAQWEFATAAVRQLFELLVNREYIEMQPSRYEAMSRYQTFGLLQMARHVEASLAYDQRTGRPIDEGRLAFAREWLASAFTEFRVPRKKGTWAWADTWAGKTIRQLSDASPSSIRMDQYRLLYSAWSEQTHASPSALLVKMMGGEAHPDEIVAADDVRIAETIASAVTMFLELWGHLPAIPGPEREQAKRWYAVLLRNARKHGGTVVEGTTTV